MIAINLLRSLPPIPQSLLWKEGTSMSRKTPNTPADLSGLTPDASTDFVTEINRPTLAQPSGDNVRRTATADPASAATVAVSNPVEANRLPLDWILDPEKGRGLSERVMARLLLAEAKSGDPDHKLAYRLAWHIVLHAMKGDAIECSVVTLAYYSVCGCHEDQYYGRVMIRRAAMFGDANRLPFPKPSPIKKQVQSTAAKKARRA